MPREALAENAGEWKDKRSKEEKSAEDDRDTQGPDATNPKP